MPRDEFELMLRSHSGGVYPLIGAALLGAVCSQGGILSV